MGILRKRAMVALSLVIAWQGKTSSGGYAVYNPWQKWTRTPEYNRDGDVKSHVSSLVKSIEDLTQSGKNTMISDVQNFELPKNPVRGTHFEQLMVTTLLDDGPGVLAAYAESGKSAAATLAIVEVAKHRTSDFYVLLQNELDYNLEKFFRLSQVSSTATIATAFFQALRKKAFDCISFLTTCWIAVQIITLSKIDWKHWHEPLATVDTNCSSPCRGKQPQKVWLTWTVARHEWREYKTALLELTGGTKMRLNSWSRISRLKRVWWMGPDHSKFEPQNQKHFWWFGDKLARGFCNICVSLRRLKWNQVVFPTTRCYPLCNRWQTLFVHKRSQKHIQHMFSSLHHLVIEVHCSASTRTLQNLQLLPDSSATLPPYPLHVWNPPDYVHLMVSDTSRHGAS